MRPVPVEIEKSNANQLLKAMANGDRTVADKLLPLIYGELHRLASSYMRNTCALLHILRGINLFFRQDGQLTVNRVTAIPGGRWWKRGKACSHERTRCFLLSLSLAHDRSKRLPRGAFVNC